MENGESKGKCKHCFSSPSQAGTIWVVICSKCDEVRIALTEGGKPQPITEDLLFSLESEQLGDLLYISKYPHVDAHAIAHHAAKILCWSRAVCTVVPQLIATSSDLLRQLSVYELALARQNSKWLELEKRIMALEGFRSGTLEAYTND